MSTIKITNKKLEDLTPIVHGDAAKYKKLLPDRLFDWRYSFEIAGVHPTIPNALRRACSQEIPIKYLDFDDYETTDGFMLVDFVRRRVNLIPIDQRISKDAVFKLVVKNTDVENMDVLSGEIEVVKNHKGGDLPFNSNIILVELLPGKIMNIPNIVVAETTGMIDGCASAAINATSIQLDVTPYNQYTKEGTKSQVANPRHFRVTFVNNGILKPEQLLTRGCDVIIERLERVKLTNIITSERENALILNNENDTIGSIFMAEATQLMPDIKAITYATDTIVKVLTIRFKVDEPAKFVAKVCDSLSSKFKTIRKQFE